MSSRPPRKIKGTTMAAMMRNSHSRFLLRGIAPEERVLSYFFFFSAVIGDEFAKTEDYVNIVRFCIRKKLIPKQQICMLLNLTCFVKDVTPEGSFKAKQNEKSK